jgi:hypothetical protein
MTKATFTLNDPARAARKKGRIAAIRARVEQALSREKCTLPAEEVNALIDAAWRYESGGLPSLLPKAKSMHRDVHNRVAKDAKRIRAALDELGESIEKSSPATHGELDGALGKAGVTPDEANRVLSALQAVAREMADKPEVRAKQGNTVKPLAAWALTLWPALDRRGMGMRESARVLAAALDGDAEGIYQAIRNSLSR